MENISKKIFNLPSGKSGTLSELINMENSGESLDWNEKDSIDLNKILRNLHIISGLK